MPELSELIVRVSADVRQAQDQLRRVTETIREFQQAGSRAGDTVDAALAQRFRQAGEQIQGVGRGLADTGRTLTVGVTTPLAALGGLALKAAADFEQSMNLLRATSGATGSQMRELSSLAIRLGGDINLPNTSASDAARAMLELSKAGLTMRDTMAAARGVLQLSAAAQISNAQAAEFTASALNAFRLPGLEAARVADLLAAAAKSSMGTISDMGLALQQSAAVFKQSRVPIQDAVNAIALMAQAGIQGSDAGTSLKTMMLSLMAPTDTAAKTMAVLGLNVRDAQGRMLPLRGIIQQFQTALSGMSDAQRDAALKTIFGTDAIRAANIVLLGGVNSWDAMLQKVLQSGAAQELAAAQARGLNGAFQSLRSSLETLALSATPYLESLARIIRRLAEWINWLNDLNPAVKNVIVIAGLFAAALGPVMVVLGNVVRAVGVLVANWGTVLAVGRVLAAFFTGPLGLALAAVVAGVTALAAAWNTNFLGIRDTARSVGAFLVPHLAAVWNTIHDTALAVWGEVSRFLREVWPPIVTIVRAAVTALRDMLVEGFALIRRLFDGTFPGLVLIVRGAWDIIVGVVKVAWGLVTAILGTGLKLLSGDWERAWGLYIRQVRLAWEGIGQIIRGAVIIIGSIIASGAAIFLNIGRELIQGLIRGIKGSLNDLSVVMRELARALVQGVRRALGIRSPSTVFEELGRDTGMGFARGLEGTRGAVVGAMQSLLRAPNTLGRGFAPTLGTPSLAGAGGFAGPAGGSLLPPAPVVVAAPGGGGGGAATINMTVVTPNAESFRRSRSQILQDLHRMGGHFQGRNG